MVDPTPLYPGDSQSRGGGPEGPDMENRVSKLEQQFASIDAKLERLAPIEAQLAELKIHVSQLPKAAEFGEMKGQLSQMPKVADLTATRTEIAEIKGKLSLMPNNWVFGLGLIGLGSFILAVLRFVKI